LNGSSRDAKAVSVADSDGRTLHRLDSLLVERGLFPSRNRAQGAIMAGKVQVDGRVIIKAGTRVEAGARIEVLGDPIPFASRGGLKLDHALDVFELDVTGANAIDVGASTGGFTDCLLQRGASRVTAVDVGYGQLAWRLRCDPRVVAVDRTNIRYVQPGDLSHAPFDLAAIDVSFISLSLVLPAVARLLEEGADVLALVKPQFEVGRGRVGKGGIVRDPQAHRDALLAVLARCREGCLLPLGLTPSPVAGAEGNREFLLWSAKEDSSGRRPGNEPISSSEEEGVVSRVVEMAHQQERDG